jgi:hypothetical protein
MKQGRNVTKRDKSKCIRIIRCKERSENHMQQKEKGI